MWRSWKGTGEKQACQKYPNVPAIPPLHLDPQPSSLPTFCLGCLFNSGPKYRVKCEAVVATWQGSLGVQESNMAPHTELLWPLEKKGVGQEAPRAMASKHSTGGLQWGSAEGAHPCGHSHRPPKAGSPGFKSPCHSA